MQALSLFSIDPSTGLLSGPLAQPPAELAPELQAQSDRAMLRLRQQRMQEATDMQRGALGLMQSYRPGGGAALEAGVYDRTAASLRAEAAAYTPPDLLFPYREAKASEARSDAKKQANLELLVNAGAGLAQTATSAFADSLGGLGVPGGTMSVGELPVGEGVMPAGTPPAQPGPGQPPQPGAEAPAQPGGGPAAQPESGPAGQPGGMPAGQAAASYAPGSDGNFSSNAFAMGAAAGISNPVMQTLNNTLMNNIMSAIMRADPFYAGFSRSVNNLLLN